MDVERKHLLGHCSAKSSIQKSQSRCEFCVEPEFEQCMTRTETVSVSTESTERQQRRSSVISVPKPAVSSIEQAMDRGRSGRTRLRPAKPTQRSVILRRVCQNTSSAWRTRTVSLLCQDVELCKQGQILSQSFPAVILLTLGCVARNSDNRTHVGHHLWIQQLPWLD